MSYPSYNTGYINRDRYKSREITFVIH